MQNHDKNPLPEPDESSSFSINEYPFPIAFYYQKITENTSLSSKLKAVFETYEGVISYLGMILLSFYYSGKKRIESLDSASRKLESPIPEDWFFFLQTAVASLPDETILVTLIKEWYNKMEEKKRIYIHEIKDYKKTDREIGMITNFHEIIKAILPVLPIMLEEEIQTYLNFCQHSLNKILKELSFLQQYPLYYPENISSEKKVLKKLVGSNRTFSKVSIEIPHKLNPNHVFIYCPESRVFQSLYPFVVYQECYYCIREELAETWEMFLFYGRTASRIAYRGFVHNLAMREHIENYLQIQQGSAISMNLESIKEIWEAAFQNTEETIHFLKENKILKGYYERKSAEYLIQSFMDNTEYSLLMIMGESGCGKTTLLAEQAKRWMTQGEIVFFFPVFGNRCAIIKDDLSNILGGKESWDKAINLMKKSGQKWTIILDQVENSADPASLFKNLASFMGECKDFSKVIISINDLYYKLWERYLNIPQLKGNFMPVTGRCPFVDEGKPYFHLTGFTMAEVSEAYKMMVSETVSPITPYDSFSKNIRGMLRNPSFMRIFLQCLKNREVPTSLGINDVMEGFVLNQINCSKQRREFLEHYVELLLKSKTTKINLDNIVDNGDTFLIGESLAPSCSSSLFELMRDGILGRVLIPIQDRKEAFIYFPLTLLQEYLVYRTLALIGKHRDEILADNIKDLSEGNRAIYGLVYFAMLRLANKQYFDRLAKVANESKDGKIFVRYLLYKILVFKEQTSSGRIGEGGAVDSIVNTLLSTSPSSEVLLGLADFGIYLYREENYAGAAFLLEKLSQQLPETGQEYDPLVLSILAAYSYQKIHQEKQAVKIYKRCYKPLKKFENTPEEVLYYLFLARAHRELGDKEKTEFFFQKCQEFTEKIQGKPIEADLYEEFGKSAEQAGDYSKALKYFQKQQDILEKRGDKEYVGDVLESIARVQYRLGEKLECISLLTEASESFEDIGDVKRLAFSQKKLGIVLADMGKHEEAKEKLAECLPVIEALDDPLPLAETYLHLGRVYDNLEKEELCREYFNKAVQILKKLGDENNIAECYEKFGLLDLKKGKVENAIGHFSKALEIYNRTNNKLGLGNVYNHLGNASQSKGELNDALKHFKESLKIREQLSDQLGTAEGYNSLATILAHVQKFSEALDMLAKARDIYQKITNKKGLASVKSTEALLYKLQSNNSEALQAYKECAQLLNELGENAALGVVYNSIGLIYKERGDFYEALSYFEKSAKIQELIQDLPGLAASYNNMGLIYDARNEYEKALEYYTKDLKITEKLGDKRGLATSYNNIAILYYNNKNYARALWHLEKALALYEELKEPDLIKMLQDRIQHVRKKL